MIDDFGFSVVDLRGFMLNGLDAAWVDDSTRRTWREGFTREFDAAAVTAAAQVSPAAPSPRAPP